MNSTLDLSSKNEFLIIKEIPEIHGNDANWLKSNYKNLSFIKIII